MEKIHVRICRRQLPNLALGEEILGLLEDFHINQPEKPVLHQHEGCKTEHHILVQGAGNPGNLRKNPLYTVYKD